MASGMEKFLQTYFFFLEMPNQRGKYVALIIAIPTTSLIGPLPPNGHASLS
jgi:hypothetical protein